MRSPISAILLAGMAMLVACCTLKPGCIIQDKVVQIATSTVATTLQCSNTTAIQNDLTGLISGLGLCKSSATAPTGPIADYLCPLAVNSVLSYLASSTIPSTWGCTASNAKATLSDALMAACKKIPVDAK